MGRLYFWTILTVVAAASGPALGQTQTAFEVASIKPSNSQDTGYGTHTREGRIWMDNIPLKELIKMAYDVKDFTLSGPSWLDSMRFDIVAKPPAGASRRQMPEMLQAMLVERFKLQTHRESKEVPAYALVVAKGGAKVKAGALFGSTDAESGRTNIDAKHMPMAQFAEWLSTRLDRPVVDQTELKGFFDLKVKWTPDDQRIDADSGPSVFTALEEQLGLKLQARKLAVDILVVDHAERAPTEN